MSIMDMGGEELKKHYDTMNNKNGWLQKLAKERVALASYRDSITELYGDKNPNFIVKYKDINGNNASMKLKDVHRMISKYDNQMQALLFGALNDIDPATGEAILSREEAMTIATLTGEDGYGVDKFFKVKNEKLGYFQKMYDNNSKTLNTSLNNISKLLKNKSDVDWGALARAATSEESSAFKNDLTAIVSRKDYVDNYPVQGLDMENKSNDERIRQLFSDLENGNVNQDDLNLIFSNIGMTATDGRTMAKAGLRAWGGANYFEFKEDPSVVGGDIFNNLDKDGDSVETDPDALDPVSVETDPDVLYPTGKEVDPGVLNIQSDETDPQIKIDARLAAATRKANDATREYREELLTGENVETDPNVLNLQTDVTEGVTASTAIQSAWNALTDKGKSYLSTQHDINNLDALDIFTGGDAASIPALPEGSMRDLSGAQDSLQTVKNVQDTLGVKIDNPQATVDSVNAVTEATQNIDDSGGSASDWVIPASILTGLAAAPKTVQAAKAAKDIAVKWAHGIQKTAKYLNSALKINAAQVNFFLNDDMVIKGMKQINNLDDEIASLSKDYNKLTKGRNLKDIEKSTRFRKITKQLEILKESRKNMYNGIVNKYSGKWNVSKQDVGRLFKRERLGKWNIFKLRGQIRTKASSLANKFIRKPAQKVSSAYIPYTIGYNITEALGAESDIAKRTGGVAGIGTAYRIYQIASSPKGRKALASFAKKQGLKKVGTAALAGGGMFSWATALIGAGWTMYDIYNFIQDYQLGDEDTAAQQSIDRDDTAA